VYYCSLEIQLLESETKPRKCWVGGRTSGDVGRTTFDWPRPTASILGRLRKQARLTCIVSYAALSRHSTQQSTCANWHFHPEEIPTVDKTANDILFLWSQCLVERSLTPPGNLPRDTKQRDRKRRGERERERERNERVASVGFFMPLAMQECSNTHYATISSPSVHAKQPRRRSAPGVSNLFKI
jgi:hypothetical protein